jgi:acyl carrier protein
LPDGIESPNRVRVSHRRTDRFMDDTQVQVIELLNQRVGIDGLNTSEGSTLADAGIDSLSLVSLMIDLETTFGIRFPAETVTNEVFRSVETLSAVIRDLRARSATAAF